MHAKQSSYWSLLLPLLLGGWLEPAHTAHAQASTGVRCESINGQFARCAAGWRDAELVRRDSKAACRRGEGWGVDRDGLWADRGCRGVFVEVGHATWHGDRHRDDRWERRDGDQRDHHWHPGPGWNREIRLACHSNQNRYQFCEVDVGRHGEVELQHRVSDARCSEGYSWGWNRAGVWTDHGCRGVFVVHRRW